MRVTCQPILHCTRQTWKSFNWMVNKMRKAFLLTMVVVFGSCLYTGTFVYLNILEQSEEIAQYETKVRQFIVVPFEETNSVNLDVKPPRRQTKSERMKKVTNKSEKKIDKKQSMPVVSSDRSMGIWKKKVSSAVRQKVDNTEQTYKLFTRNELFKTYSIKEELEKRVEGTRSDEYFPVDVICPYLGLRKRPYIKFNTAPRNKFCIPRQPTEEECAKAANEYRVDNPPIKCKDQPEKELCAITNQWRASIETKVHVNCDFSRCDLNSIFVAPVDPKTGKLEKKDKWYNFTSNEDFENKITAIVKHSSKNGLNFCYVQCLKNGSSEVIRTVLVFPPVAETAKTTTTEAPFSVNIVVLNSVSRAHFYRSLTDTVSNLRKIVYSTSIPATVLDFELLQSTGPTTKRNGQDFTSEKERKLEPATYKYSRILTLFAEAKKQGFRIMFQTDACSHDTQVSVKEDIIHSKETGQVSEDEYETLTRLYQEGVVKNVTDDVGMTQLSCETLSQTNGKTHFGNDKPEPSCLNGRYLHTYFLDYIGKAQLVFRSSKKKAVPTFSYTYMTLAHKSSGIQIQQIDERLSKFVNNMAKQQNTLTMITSEYGPTVTKYSLDSIHGRYEIYDSLLFMIIPETVASKLGRRRMKHLTTNQIRLISLTDIRKTLVALVSQMKDDQGLLSEIPENRTCADVGVTRGILCKCDGWENWLSNDHSHLTWIAEYVLGELNNNIQDLTKQEIYSLNHGNFGGCQRLVGYAVEKINHRVEGQAFILSMDIIVQPERQVFEAQVQLPVSFGSAMILSAGKPAFQTIYEPIKLLHYKRLGSFRDFSICRDRRIPVHLCVCDRNRSRNKTNAENIKFDHHQGIKSLAIEIIASNFGVKPRTQIVDQRTKCLLLLTRTHLSHTVVYELANICRDRIFIAHVDLNKQSSKQAFFTTRLPIRVEMPPISIYFLFSAYQPAGGIHLKPKIYFKVVSL